MRYVSSTSSDLCLRSVEPRPDSQLDPSHFSPVRAQKPQLRLPVVPARCSPLAPTTHPFTLDPRSRTVVPEPRPPVLVPPHRLGIVAADDAPRGGPDVVLAVPSGHSSSARRPLPFRRHELVLVRWIRGIIRITSVVEHAAIRASTAPNLPPVRQHACSAPAVPPRHVPAVDVKLRHLSSRLPSVLPPQRARRSALTLVDLSRYEPVLVPQR